MGADLIPPNATTRQGLPDETHVTYSCLLVTLYMGTRSPALRHIGPVTR